MVGGRGLEPLTSAMRCQRFGRDRPGVAWNMKRAKQPAQVAQTAVFRWHPFPSLTSSWKLPVLARHNKALFSSRGSPPGNSTPSL